MFGVLTTWWYIGTPNQKLHQLPRNGDAKSFCPAFVPPTA